MELSPLILIGWLASKIFLKTSFNRIKLALYIICIYYKRNKIIELIFVDTTGKSKLFLKFI